MIEGIRKLNQERPSLIINGENVILRPATPRSQWRSQMLSRGGQFFRPIPRAPTRYRMRHEVYNAMGKAASGGPAQCLMQRVGLTHTPEQPHSWGPF